MDSKGNESENGAENQESDRTDLYNAIRSRSDITCAAYLLRVNSQNEAVPPPPVAEPHIVDEENVRKAPSRGGSQLRGGGDNEDTEHALRAPDEQLSNWRPEKGVRKNLVGNGAIKVHCLSSNVQILVPETHKNEPAVGIPTRRVGNLTPRPRTALASSVLKSRSVSVVSSISRGSNYTWGSINSRPSTMNSMYNVNEKVRPESSRTFREKMNTIAEFAEDPSRFMTPRIFLNSKLLEQADLEEDQLRQLFQLPPPVEQRYKTWHVGTEDPTEEAMNLQELSETLFHKEIRERPHQDEDNEDAGDGEVREVKKEYRYYISHGQVFDSLAQFMQMPAPPGYSVKCIVTRQRAGINGSLFPLYFLHLEREGDPLVLLLTAKRISPIKNNYVISTNPAEFSRKSSSCIGYLSGNLRGSEFVLKTPSKKDPLHRENRVKKDAEEREWDEILTFQFNPSVLGTKGPRRSLTVLPKLKSDWQRCNPGPLLEAGHNFLVHVKNKSPIWNQERNRYTLNFNDRVEISSVKNFQLSHPTCDATLMQFGRLEKPETFILDYSYPFCALQAFSIALANFDPKLGLD